MPRHVPTQGPRSLVGTSPPRRQHRNEATTGLLRGYYESYYEATTRLLRGYYAATTRLLPGHYQATTRLLRGYYQEPHAHHSASSTAAASPLVCWRCSSWQLEAGVDDPHTEQKRLEEAVLHVQLKSAESGGRARHTRWCSQPSCWLCQQATTDSQMKPGTTIKLDCRTSRSSSP